MQAQAREEKGKRRTHLRQFLIKHIAPCILEANSLSRQVFNKVLVLFLGVFVSGPAIQIFRGRKVNRKQRQTWTSVSADSLGDGSETRDAMVTMMQATLQIHTLHE